MQFANEIVNRWCEDEAFLDHQQRRIAHWDGIARQVDSWPRMGKYYHSRLSQIYHNLIPSGQRVIEIGCAEGDLLAEVEPSRGVGMDFSSMMIELAQRRHPEFTYIHADAHHFVIDEVFDYIVLSDLVNDLWDIQSVFENISRISHPKTRIVMNFYSRLWETPLALAKWMKLARPTLNQNWVTVEDVNSILELADFEVIRAWEEILWPLPVSILERLLNRFLVKIWPFYHLALTHFVIARPVVKLERDSKTPNVSVVIPVRNEAGNIRQIFERVPEMGGWTELIFVEGHSRDGTYETIQQAILEYPSRICKLLRQPGEGKGDAVRHGFAHANGEILMILDGDITVPPEDLTRFYNALVFGKAEFVNGVRLVYPIQDRAMRLLNLIGNKFFSLAFSWVLGFPIKDTLCGTKALWRDDYEHISANRRYFGDFDPFGDFDLIFGAAKLNLKVIDLPVRYRERRYGQTNIQRWRHGLLLLRMLLIAGFRLKFI